MKLKQSLIVLALILLFHSSYSQYPVKRVFRGDSVVIMKVSQADTINMLYKSYNDTITNLKNSITEKKYIYDSLNQEIYRKKDTIFYWEGKYQASRELYFPKQRNIDKEEAFHLLQKILLIGVIILQFTQLH